MMMIKLKGNTTREVDKKMEKAAAALIWKQARWRLSKRENDVDDDDLPLIGESLQSKQHILSFQCNFLVSVSVSRLSWVELSCE